MEYQKMNSLQEELTEYTSYQKAKKATESHIRLIMQNRKLVTLPAEVPQLTHIPYFELDLSYNRTINITNVINQLSVLDNLKGLALTKNDLGDIPAEISLLKNLESLTLWNNGLTNLPDSFEALTQLRYLHLRTNKLTTIPVPIFKLTELRFLCLRNNRLKKLPPALFDLSKLEHLDISNCGLTAIPEDIAKLTNLRILEIEGNKLSSLPAGISKLKKLETIRFRANNELPLDEVIKVLKDLPQLKTLDLTNYELETLPPSVGQLQYVENLQLDQNKLKELPGEMGALPSLKAISVKGNPELSLASYLRTISGIRSITRLESQDLPLADALPDEIGLCTNLESLQVGGKYQSISGAIGKLNNLKEFSISFYGDAGLTVIPDVFDQLGNLQSVSISGLNNLASFPETLYQSSTLQKLRWNTNLPLDFSKLAQIRSLKDLTTKIINEEELIPLSTNTSLERLHIINQEITQLPGSFVNMLNLKDFVFSSLPALDIEDAITKLPALEKFSLISLHNKPLPANLHLLKNLKSVVLGHDAVLPYTAMIEMLKQCPSIEELEFYTNDFIVPAEITLLNRVRSCRVFFVDPDFHEKRQVSTALEFALLDTSRVSYVRIPGAIKDKVEALKKIALLNLKTDDQKMMAYGILTGAFDLLKKRLPHLFPTEAGLHGKTIFIFGKPTLSNLKELQQNLKAAGATIAKKADETATHILLTSRFNEDIAPILLLNKPVILEDFIKQQVFDKEKPYLMEEGNDELTKQVTRLLRSEDTDNINLVLELIEGGGANKRLVAYLAVIHLKHTDNEIRKKARTLFRKFAAAEVQAHIKAKWKDSYRDKHYRNYIKSLLPPGIDLFDFIFAEHMVALHTDNTQNNSYSGFRFQLLRLDTYHEKTFPSSFKYLDFLEEIYINDGNGLDLQASYPIFSHFNLKRLTVQYYGGDTFPVSLLNFNGLEQLSLSAIHDNRPSVPVLAHHSALKEFNLTNFDVSSTENIAALALTLHSLELDQCNLREFPAFLANCSELKTLKLQCNLIEHIDFNFSSLKKLSGLSLYGCPVKTMSDTFYNCKELTDIAMSNMQLKEVPFSLFTTGEKWRSIYLRLDNNEIERISDMPAGFKTSAWRQSLARFNFLNLESNKLASIPALLSYFEIDELKLDKNPITALPADIDKYQCGRISMDRTNITKIPVELFHSKANIHIGNYDTAVELPPLELVPEYAGYKSFYVSNADPSFKKMCEAIEKKKI
ncbi:MAG: leucine-rich repeat domain-containing protein [Ferruginibacter sp.]